MARGSHTTWGRYDARVCIICGQPIRITTQACWMHHDDQTGEHRSAHIACGSPLGGTMTETTTEEPTPQPEPDPEPDDDGDDGEEADGDDPAE